MHTVGWPTGVRKKRESGVLLCLGREVREHLYGNSLCGCVNRKPLREKEESLSARHHRLRYRSVDLLISGVLGLERGRGVGG